MEKKEKKDKLEFAEKFTYNKVSDTYVLPVKHRTKPLVLKGYKVRAIRRALSNVISPSQSAADVCLKFKLLSDDLDEIKKIFGITRDAFPLTDEEVDENTVEKTAEVIREEKQSAALQLEERKSWKETQEDAEKWRAFQNGVLDPFSEIVDNIPATVSKIKWEKPNYSTGQDNRLLISLNDVHFGAHAEANEVFNQNDTGWSIEDTVKAVDKYSEKISQLVASRTTGFSECLVTNAGDIIHGIYGQTTKGTPIEAFPQGQKQWDIAFKSLCRFYDNLQAIFPKVSVKTVAGNHSAFGDTVLSKAHEAFYSKSDRINFDIRDARWCDFVFGGAGFILEHGSSAFFKSKLPAEGAPREAYVQRLFWEKRQKFIDCKRLYFLSADFHEFYYGEYATFDAIVFSSLVGADKYADNLNLRGQPRQNGLVISEGRVTECVNFYLD